MSQHTKFLGVGGLLPNKAFVLIRLDTGKGSILLGNCHLPSGLDNDLKRFSCLEQLLINCFSKSEFQSSFIRRGCIYIIRRF